MEFGEHNRRLVQKVTKLEPDMIALTGDFIESPEDLPVVAALVSELSQIAPVCSMEERLRLRIWHFPFCRI